MHIFTRAMRIFFTFILGSMFTVGVSAQIDEIIVTANKREQSLQDIPMTVSVATAQQIERSAIVDLMDLGAAVPTLRVNQLQNSAQTNFVIRGYGNGANNPGIEPAVGIYIDGVSRTRASSAIGDLPGVERVEVLSGPQSTLFGKNASAGVISITTKLPEKEFGGMVSATVGNHGARIVKGTLTGGISDTLSFRVSASSNEMDGFTTNLLDGSDMNNRDRHAIRGQLMWEPSDDLSVRIIADTSEIDEECCGAAMLQIGAYGPLLSLLAGGRSAPVDPQSRNVYANYSPSNKLDGDGISMHIKYDLGFATLTSITAQLDQEARSTFDADFSATKILAENRLEYDFDHFTQEFRLTSNDDGPIQWTVGAYYSDEDVETFRNVTYGDQIFPFADALITAGLSSAIGAQATAGYLASGAPPAGAAAFAASAVQATLAPVGGSGINFVGAAFGACLVNGVPCSAVFFVPNSGDEGEFFTQSSKSLSFFGQMDYALTDNLTITLGLNHTDDKKDVVGRVQVNDPFAALPLALAGLQSLEGLQFFKAFTSYGGPNDAEPGVFDSDDTTHTFRLAYDISDDTTVYASHSTGFKAQSANLSIDGRTPYSRSADPEEATSYEIGLKMQFANGYLNMAYFHQSIEGFQSNVFTGTGFNLANAGEETHEGVEVDMVMALSENFVVNFSGIFIDAVYDDFKQGACDATGLAEAEFQCPLLADGSRADFLDYTGLDPAGVHDISFNANATYSFDINDGMEGFMRLEYLHEEDVKLADLIPKNLASRGSDNINASFGVSSERGGWSAMIWGRNLTDHKSLISAFPTTAAPGSYSGYPTAPRTYGITVRKNF
jgi:iron complex outermembrane receptor protein